MPRVSLALASLLLAPAALADSSLPQPTTGGSVGGRVRFVGESPQMAPQKRGMDPYCEKIPKHDQTVVVNANHTLKNVVVWLADAPRRSPPPSEAVLVEQRECEYVPRVQGAQAGQTVRVKNRDDTLHNVHTYQGTTALFNQAQLPSGGYANHPIEKRFTSERGHVVKLKCDVHPWMAGYVFISDHPFFAVTGDDGSFSIRDVPPGTYRLEAWHERYGTRTTQVTVGSSGRVEAELVYQPPSRGADL